MPCLQPCCSNGHGDISGSLSHVIVCTSEHESVHSLLKELTSSDFNGQSRHCLRFSTFPCSFSSLAWWRSYSTLIPLFSGGYCRVSASAPFCTDASRPCQSFVTTAHTSPHSRCQYGTLLLGYHFSHFEFFGYSRIFVPKPIVALMIWL